MDNNILSIENISMMYGSNKSEALKLLKEGKEKDLIYKKTGVTVALRNVSFDVRRGEIFVIIGLSGSGKSTLVRCLNMLNNPTSGSIRFQDDDISKFNNKDLIDYRRNKISMVFQNFGLMSHRNVLGNVEYGLEVKNITKEVRHEKAKQVISMVGLEGLENESIDNLSGGMKQRVGIARALANDPEILLMDEPFSALDPLVRKDMQFELLSIHRKLDNTIIFITHDIDEAFKLGDRVAIMRDGKIIQIATPEEMSLDPINNYVEQFIDSADKSQVLTVKSIMITPSCIVRVKDSAIYAIKVMNSNGISSAYVVDDRLTLKGVLTIEDAIKSRNEKQPIFNYITEDIQIAAVDDLISDIMPKAVDTRFPIAIVDENNKLKGIVSKASVLSSLMSNNNE